MSDLSNNYQDKQNFNIDFEKVYDDIIKEIDDSRSVVNITNKDNQKVLDSLTKKSLSDLRQSLKVERLPQESRCHAFFRMIGFPVCGEDGFYNPGFDNVILLNNDGTVKDKKINDDTKIHIIKTLKKGFSDLSLFRETYLLGISAIFNANESIDASVLSLSSSSSTRRFLSASEKSSYNDFNTLDQSYDTDFNQGLIGSPTSDGSIGKISLLEYIDSSGNNPTKLSYFSKRYHIIFPFMVDPLIDLSVSPASKKFSVPFVLDNSNLRIGENEYVKRPFIEKVIRDRFSYISPNTSYGNYMDSIKEYIKNIPSIENLELIQSIISTGTGIEQAKFDEYVNIMSNMLYKLSLAKLKIKYAQLNYYWLPIPSNVGPENGVKVRPFMSQFSQKIVDKKMVTLNDKELFNAIVKSTLSQYNTQANNAKLIANSNNFALSQQSTISPDSTTSFGNRDEESLNILNSKRSQLLEEAGSALRTIEIVMGEFSGLGLCDILAIIAALYTMPKDKLIGFLDDDAFDRAKQIFKAQEIVFLDKKPTVEESLESFTSVVKDYYILMDKMLSNFEIYNNRR